MDECDCDYCCGSLVGPQGFIGTQGLATNGTQGPIGTQGEIAIGAQGEQGFQAQDVTGLQGFDGSQGAIDAVDAINGPDGDIGPQGQLDQQGPQGLVGQIGPQGLISSQDSGPVGYQGPSTNAGVQGYQGPQGTSNGPQGAVGYQGVPFQSTITEDNHNFPLVLIDALISFIPPTINITTPSLLRIVIHCRIDVATQPVYIGLYDLGPMTPVGPVGYITIAANHVQTAYVMARHVLSGSYAIGVNSAPASQITFFNVSVLAMF